MKKKIIINGMKCDHCVGHVREALSRLEGVLSIQVNLKGDYALVDTTVRDEKLKDVIEDEGYDVICIENAE